MDEKELNKHIKLLRIELNQSIEKASFDLSQEYVLEKSRELDKCILEYQKRYINLH